MKSTRLRPGSPPTKASSPVGIARAFNDLRDVAGGGSNNLVKLDTTGNYISYLSHPDMTRPHGAAFDDRGYLYSNSF